MAGTEEKILYPNLGRRIKAVLVDSMSAVVLLVTLVPLLAKMDIQNTPLKLIVLTSPFFILEPLLISFTGGSIGHHVFQICVRNAASGRHIGIFSACTRSIIKLFLGSISLVLILFTNRHQALHDLMSNSVVTFKTSGSVAAQSGLEERSVQEADFIHPSRRRKLIVIIAYNALLLMAFMPIAATLISSSCLQFDNCSAMDDILSEIIGIFWLAGLCGTIYLGIRGRLPGCKRRKRK